MSSGVEAHSLARVLFPLEAWRERESNIDRLLRFLNRRLPKSITRNRAKRIYDGELPQVSGDELDVLRDEHNRREEQKSNEALKAALEKARYEHQKAQHRIATLEALLRVQDSDFHSPEIERLRGLAGRQDSPVD